MPNMLQISSCKIGGTAVPSSSAPSSFPERASNPRLLRAAAEAEFKRRRNPTGNLQIHGAGKAPPTPPVIVHADHNFVAVKEPEILPPPPPPQPVIPEPVIVLPPAYTEAELEAAAAAIFNEVTWEEGRRLAQLCTAHYLAERAAAAQYVAEQLTERIVAEVTEEEARQLAELCIAELAMAAALEARRLEEEEEAAAAAAVAAAEKAAQQKKAALEKAAAVQRAYMARVAAEAAKREEEEAEEEEEPVPAPAPAAPFVRPRFGGATGFDFGNVIANSVFDHIRGTQEEVSIPQLEAFLRARMGESEERIAKMVADLDLNGDGMIDRGEWQRAWNDGVVSALRP